MFFKLRILWDLISLKLHKVLLKNNLKKLQTLRWKSFKKTLLKSPYYHDYASQNKPLRDYPIMNKESFMANFNQINTKEIRLDNALEVAKIAETSRDFSPMIGSVTVGLSSGTSGNKGVFLATESERAQWVASIIDRVIGFSLRKRKVAFFLRANSNLYDSVTSNLIQFKFFDLFDPLENHVNRLNTLQPHILIGQPSLLLELANKIEKGELVISPKKVISVAEVLYPEDQIRLAKLFKQNIHQVYQCTEGFLASTCAEGTLHFNDDFLIIEKKYLDDKKDRFHPIITDLLRSTQPIIRYELNDIIIEKNGCKCGAKSLTIDKIEGRSDDILSFKDERNKTVNIYPDFFRRAIIISDNEINNYALVQKSDNLLQLFISGSSSSYENAVVGINNLLQKHNIESVKTERILTNPHKKGDKLIRIRHEN